MEEPEPDMRPATATVLARATAALKAEDRRAFRACLVELQDSVHDEPCGVTTGQVSERAPPYGRPAGRLLNLKGAEVADVRLLTDEQIDKERRRAVGQAKESIWLSTLCVRDDDRRLETLLLAKAYDRVSVTLVVAPAHAKRGATAALIEALREQKRAVAVKPAGNHSKLVVVDDEIVIVGSANLMPIWRDAAVRIRSRRAAKFFTDYLRALPEDRGSDGHLAGRATGRR